MRAVRADAGFMVVTHKAWNLQWQLNGFILYAALFKQRPLSVRPPSSLSDDFCKVRLVHHGDSGHKRPPLCRTEWITRCFLCQSWRLQAELCSSPLLVWKCPSLTRVSASHLHLARPQTATARRRLYLSSCSITMIGGVWPPYRNNRTRSLAGEKGLRKTDEVMRRFDLGIKLR